MNWRILLAAGLALVLLPSPAWASHMGQYAANPVEHDDQGRSDEPDGHSTSIGGVPVNNRVIDRNPNDGGGVHRADAVTPPKETAGANVLAPGCSVGFNRAQSGLCGIHTVGLGTSSTGPGSVIPAHTVPDVPGVSTDNNCPATGGASVGRYNNAGVGPNDARALAFLDHIAFSSVIAGPANWNDFNHKMTDLDAALGGALSGVLGQSVGDMLIGSMAEGAWFGLWGDLNCNGVIDATQDPNAAGPQAGADNEFVWLGGCTNVDDLFVPEVIAGGLCSPDPNPNSNPAGTLTNPKTTMHEWVFPGNHHGFLPGDTPGSQVICLVDQLTGGVVTSNLFGAPCTTSTNPDDYSADFWGDPILDEPNDPHFDLLMDDRTGETDLVNRQWIAGLGWPVMYYDQSLVLSTVITTGVNCPSNPTIRAKYDAGACTFTDVDKYPALSPLVESLVAGLKSTVRNQVWEPVVTAWKPINRLAQTLDKTIYDVTGGAQQGTVDDLLLDPGWSREPNTAADSYPGVAHGTCDLNAMDDREEEHRGWCNGAYNTWQSGQHRGWLDIQAARNLAYLLPIFVDPPPSPCQQCVIGPLLDNPFNGEPPASDGGVPSAEDHTRTLGAGAYRWVGFAGRWQDRSHNVDETVFPASPPAQSCDAVPGQAQCATYGLDGWIGRATEGYERYRGYPSDEPCTTEAGDGTADDGNAGWDWAVCTPYEDGNTQNPQDYDLDTGEWESAGACPLATNAVVRLTPSPSWGNAIVWREPENGVGPLGPLPELEVIPFGSTAPVTLRVACDIAEFGLVQTVDWLVLPAGAEGFSVTTSLTVSIPLRNGGFDTLTDSDTYAAINLVP